jgi:hypothetical protein
LIREFEVGLDLKLNAKESSFSHSMFVLTSVLLVVGARTPAIGLGGSTLCGGFSWMSGEYGCISDPQNLLDAQIVKVDGSVVWASQEPELLWAIRGTQGAFGSTMLSLDVPTPNLW